MLASFSSILLESQIKPFGNPLRFRQNVTCSSPYLEGFQKTENAAEMLVAESLLGGVESHG